MFLLSFEKICQINKKDYFCSDSKFETNPKPVNFENLGSLIISNHSVYGCVQDFYC